MIFFSKIKGMFLQYRSCSSWYFLLYSFVSFHLLTEPELSVWPLFGESCSCSSISRRPASAQRAGMRAPQAVFSIDTAELSNQEAEENCRLSPYCFCLVWHEWGAGQWSWRWQKKRTPVFQECVYGIKGIYLTMKHGNKCAYIEQCEYVSYRYSTSKGRASPKPKKE